MSVLGTVAGTLDGIATGGPLGGLVSGATGAAAGLVLHDISSWVLNGTRDALEQVAHAIGVTTAPNLESTWFSSTYWRVAALAAMLTVPFLCAAAVQAVARGDLGLLVRSAFGYLPLSVLGVSLAAPLTMLLLAATDQMSCVVSASAAGGGARFLDHAAQVAGALSGSPGASPFFAVVVGLLAVIAALALAIELLIRAAAVYVVVLMLPLAFAAIVWPARRMWAARTVELLISLILSKFVIVAVLSLAAAALAGGSTGIGAMLVAMSLLLLSTFAPWALMRILPFTELAAGAAGILHGELGGAHARAGAAVQFGADSGASALQIPARLRDQARRMYARTDGSEPSAADTAFSADARSRAEGADYVDIYAADGAGAPPAGDAAAGAAGAHSGVPDTGGRGAIAPEDTSVAGVATAAQDGPSAHDERPPFQLPEPWLRDEPLRLDGDLLRPPDAAGGPDQAEEQL